MLSRTLSARQRCTFLTLRTCYGDDTVPCRGVTVLALTFSCWGRGGGGGGSVNGMFTCVTVDAPLISFYFIVYISCISYVFLIHMKNIHDIYHLHHIYHMYHISYVS